jgi:hypothetical protein
MTPGTKGWQPVADLEMKQGWFFFSSRDIAYAEHAEKISVSHPFN